jgi:hypothetical protein
MLVRDGGGTSSITIFSIILSISISNSSLAITILVVLMSRWAEVSGENCLDRLPWMIRGPKALLRRIVNMIVIMIINGVNFSI